MTWPWWVLGAVVLLIAVDRLAVWAESRGWIYWRRRALGGGGGGVFGEVLLLFQPSRQHVVEERDRQRLTIVQRETGEPPLDIDLDAGTAVLHPTLTPSDPDAVPPDEVPLDSPQVRSLSPDATDQTDVASRPAAS